MAMDSFYGGRQGASFVIVYRFDAIDTSKSGEQFRCKEAAVSNTNPDLFLWQNGNFVFKDGVNYNNYTWKYLSLDGGSVATTDGDHNAPEEAAEGMVQCFSQGGNSVDKVNYGEYVIIDSPYKGNPDNGKVFRRGMNFIIDSVNNPLAGAEYIGQIVGPRGDTPKVDMDHYEDIVEEAGAVTDTLTVDRSDLIPGYDRTATNPYNDDIKYAYVNIKDQYNNVIGVMVGFQIPYLMVDYEARSITPYENRLIDPDTGEYYYDNLIDKDANFIDQNGNWIHPFYQKWQVKIPYGIHGVNSTNIEIIPTKTRPEGVEIWTNSGCTNHATVTPEGGGWLVLSDYELASNLGTSATPAGYMGQTGDVKWVRFTYTDGRILYVKQEDCYCYIIKYKETNFDNSADGEATYFTIGEKKDIQKVILSEDGILTVYYTSAEGSEVLDQVLRWLYYNASGTTPDEIGGIQIDAEGTVKVYYNTKTNGVRDVQVFEHIAGWINEVDLDDDGTLTFEFNNGSDPIVFDKKIKWIEDIKIETEVEGGIEGSGDQRVQITYNNEDEPVKVGNPLNYIIEMVITQGGTPGAENIGHQHLLIYHSDPTRRTSNIKYPSSRIPNTILTGWTDLGFVQGEPGGIHNIKNVNSLDELKRGGIWLKPEEIDEPAGSTNPTHAGWSVTYTAAPGEDPEIMFYDYNTNEWYSIGSLNSSAIDPTYIINTSKENEPPASLNINGFWFAQSSIKCAH